MIRGYRGVIELFVMNTDNYRMKRGITDEDINHTQLNIFGEK